MTETNKSKLSSTQTLPPPRPSAAVVAVEPGSSAPPKPVLSSRKADASATTSVPPSLPRAPERVPAPKPQTDAPAKSAPAPQTGSAKNSSVTLHTFEDLLADLDLLAPSVEAPPETASAPVPATAAPKPKPPEEAAVSRPKSRAGRGLRIPLALPIQVRGRQDTSRAFTEETRTVFVLPRGAVFQLAAVITTGERLALLNKAQGREIQCEVVDIQRGEAGKQQLEVEFPHAAPEFWPVSFPAEDTESHRRPGDEAKSASPVQPPTPKPIPEPAKRPEPAASVSPSEAVDLATLILADDPKGAPEKPAPASHVSTALSPALTERLAAAPRASELPIGLPITSADRHTIDLQPAHEARSGRTWFAIGAAAVLIAAVGGGAFLLRRHSANAPAATTEVSAARTDQPAAPAAAPQPAISSQPVAPISQPQPTSGASNAQVRAHEPPPVSVSAPSGTRTPARNADSASQPESGSAAAGVHGKRKIPAALNVSLVPAPRPAPVSNEPLAAPFVNVAAPNVSVSGILPGTPGAVAAPIAPPEAPLPIGGEVRPPRLLSSVTPSYPPMARNARFSGDVVIDTVIDASGKVTGMKVVSGPALLQQAAMDALRQWKYTPGTLNGKPIATQMQVTVRFRLE